MCAHNELVCLHVPLRQTHARLPPSKQCPLNPTTNPHTNTQAEQDEAARPEECQHLVAELAAQGKAMERAFKKDFAAQADSSALSKLSQLYKQRLLPAGAAAGGVPVVEPAPDGLIYEPLAPLPAPGAAPTATAAGAEGDAPQPPPLVPQAWVEVAVQPSQCPDGLEAGVWQQFLQARAARVAVELETKQAAAQQMLLRYHLHQLQQQRATLEAKVMEGGGGNGPTIMWFACGPSPLHCSQPNNQQPAGP